MQSVMHYLRLWQIAFALNLLASGRSQPLPPPPAPPAPASPNVRTLTITAYTQLTLYLDGVEVTHLVNASNHQQPDTIELPVGVTVIAVNVSVDALREPNVPMIMAKDSEGLLWDATWRCVAGNVTSDWMEPEVDWSSSSWPEAVTLDWNDEEVSGFDVDEPWLVVSDDPSQNTGNMFCRVNLFSRVRQFQVGNVSDEAMANATSSCFACNRKMVCASQCLQQGESCSSFIFEASRSSCCLFKIESKDYDDGEIEAISVFESKGKRK